MQPVVMLSSETPVVMPSLEMPVRAPVPATQTPLRRTASAWPHGPAASA